MRAEDATRGLPRARSPTGGSVRARVDALARIRTDEGYLAEVVEDADGDSCSSSTIARSASPRSRARTSAARSCSFPFGPRRRRRGRTHADTCSPATGGARTGHARPAMSAPVNRGEQLACSPRARLRGQIRTPGFAASRSCLLCSRCSRLPGSDGDARRRKRPRRSISRAPNPRPSSPMAASIRCG